MRKRTGAKNQQAPAVPHHSILLAAQRDRQQNEDGNRTSWFDKPKGGSRQSLTAAAVEERGRDVPDRFADVDVRKIAGKLLAESPAGRK